MMPGYHLDKENDLAEITALIAAAGGPDSIQDIPLVIADIFEGAFAGVGQSVANMIERNTGLTVDTEFLSYAEIREQLASGTLPAWFGWGHTPLSADPTDYFRRTAHSEGVENFGRYANPDVDSLIEDMQSTIGADERRDQAHEIQQILLEDAFWIQNVTNGIQLGLHRPYLHVPSAALDFAWSGHHLDKLWLDETHADYPPDRGLAEPAARPVDPNAAVGPQPVTSDEEAGDGATGAAE
jgi:ABC-type transport system substrate-binding protein